MAPNIDAHKYIKQIWIDIKEEADNNTDNSKEL